MRIEESFEMDKARMNEVGEREIISNLMSIGFTVKKNKTEECDDIEIEAQKNYTKILINVRTVFDFDKKVEFSEEDKEKIRNRARLVGGIPYLAKVTVNNQYEKMRVDYYEIR